MNVTLTWAAIIAFGLLMYVLLDGFDLGIGLIFPLFPDEKERDLMMAAVAPVWDGNETWLVLGGAALFAAFPVVYAIVLSALYLPIAAMLICLILRGVSFELRGKATRTKNLWNLAFVLGSAGAAFFQGVILGAYLHGIPISHGQFNGDPFFWIQPFSLICGLGLMSTYALLGTTWLLRKTEGDLQLRLHQLAWPLTIWLLTSMLIVSIWEPLSDPNIRARWFETDLLYRLLPAPVLVVLASLAMRRAIKYQHANAPFVVSMVLVMLGYAGLLISIWPYAIPYSLTLMDAAAPHSSQVFAMIGAVIILPIIIAYTTAGYWVFRGKIRGTDLYH